jgi:hypothetical protein
VKHIGQCVVAWVLLAGIWAGCGPGADGYAQKISSLIEPAKLATLERRGANPRVEKYVAILAEAKKAGVSPEKVAVEAVRLAGMKEEAAKLTVETMTRNLLIAERLGCLNAAGLEAMHKGDAPKVRKGPYKGDELSVDHIIPVAVAPELDKTIANLELMPLRMNEGKRDSVGERQKELAAKLHKAGLLSRAGLHAVSGGK